MALTLHVTEIKKIPGETPELPSQIEVSYQFVDGDEVSGDGVSIYDLAISEESLRVDLANKLDAFITDQANKPSPEAVIEQSANTLIENLVGAVIEPTPTEAKEGAPIVEPQPTSEPVEEPKV